MITRMKNPKLGFFWVCVKRSKLYVSLLVLTWYMGQRVNEFLDEEGSDAAK